MCERPAKDESSLYAQLLAKKLRALDGNEREVVMHEISDLMFPAKMQNQNFRSLPSPQWRTNQFCSGGGEGSTNSAEDRGQRERGSGGSVAPRQGFWRQL